MRQEDIKIYVSLDEQNTCERLEWEGSNTPGEGKQEAKAMALALWDVNGKGTSRIDLWNKEMNVFEMKAFSIEIIEGVADMLRFATGDEGMARELELLSKQFAEQLKRDMKNS
ncbi:gliding motility protein GldC [Eisenibacter elegans]|jgi:gliding motility-associated protein GldC|uniref:gliding motility protein GldC n=1 Tax=Eisenibacter elegans TaxID=997 RepID=UPI000402EB63|nr:gliding motility protein GldC [Eisenibacter elegans]